MYVWYCRYANLEYNTCVCMHCGTMLTAKWSSLNVIPKYLFTNICMGPYCQVSTFQMSFLKSSAIVLTVVF